MDNQVLLEKIYLCLKKLTGGSYFWKLASHTTVITVGLFSKVLVCWLNMSKIHNRAKFDQIFEKRQKHVPLITVSNHYSCIDDPLMWGTLKLTHLMNASRMRWALAAHNICFTNVWHAYLFMLGKCIPVIRGNGIYQEALDFCIERLAHGDWVHVFPEGRVNLNKEPIRFKWGVGRLIMESPQIPIIIPIWHIGTDDVLPNHLPYNLKFGKNLTFNFGQPINMSKLIEELKIKTKCNKLSDEAARKIITDKIQIELMNLKLETEVLHLCTNPNS